MPDDPTTPPADPTDTPPGDGGGNAPTLEDLQSQMNRMKAENAGLRGELKKREGRLKEFEDAQMTEQQKVAKERDELKAQLAERDKKLSDVGIRAAAVAMAARLGFNDPEDAYALLDRAAITVDDAGKATNLEELMKAILEVKPYLGRTQSMGGGPTANPGPRNPAPSGKLDMNQVLREKMGAR